MSGYSVPCDLSGGNVRVYGIHAEVDARVASDDNKFLAISISGVVNPDRALKGNKNKVDVTHKRWSYPGGPVFIVHENLALEFEDDMDPNELSVTCGAYNGYSEISYPNKAAVGLHFIAELKVTSTTALKKTGELTMTLSGLDKPT